MSESPTTLQEVERFRFLRERLTALADTVLNRPEDTVFWIGAGFSAKYAGLPTWTQFLQNLLQQEKSLSSRDLNLIHELISSGRLTLAAECLQDSLGNRLLETLTSTFGKVAHLPEHLSYFGVRDVITTNYDMLLEQALPWYRSISPSDGMEKLVSNDFKIVKIHGSVSDPSSCVLSLSAYVRAYNVNLHWYLANVFTSSTVVFLGTSMNPTEPYFRVLRLLQAQQRTRPRHFAIMAVPDSQSGAREGRRLKDFGIDLIPYIPDGDHSFIDEVMAYVESRRGSSEAVNHRLGIVRKNLSAGRTLDAVIYLWHTCHADVSRSSDRRAIGDTVSEVFNRTLGDSNESTTALVRRCQEIGIDLAQLWQRTADLLVPSIKSVHGLRQSLRLIEAATAKRYPHLARRLAELEKQVAGSPPGRTSAPNP